MNPAVSTHVSSLKTPAAWSLSLPRRRTRRAWLVLLFVATTTLSGADARAQDEWLGPDKALHFSVSAGLAGGGYALGVPLFECASDTAVPCDVPRFALGGGIALTAGIAKEVFDLLFDGDPSWKDLTWDVIGIVVGLAIAWGVDRLFRDSTETAPPESSTSRSSSVTFRRGSTAVLSADRW